MRGEGGEQRFLFAGRVGERAEHRRRAPRSAPSAIVVAMPKRNAAVSRVEPVAPRPWRSRSGRPRRRPWSRTRSWPSRTAPRRAARGGAGRCGRRSSTDARVGACWRVAGARHQIGLGARPTRASASRRRRSGRRARARRDPAACSAASAVCTLDGAAEAMAACGSRCRAARAPARGRPRAASRAGQRQPLPDRLEQHVLLGEQPVQRRVQILEADASGASAP